MTYEPGTADILTTCAPSFPGEERPQRVILTAEHGWQIVLINLDDAYVEAGLIHPWHGLLTSVVYRR
jgi:hypothetical protein